MAFDFRPKSRVPNYQSRGMQYKLLGLVMMLGMAVIVMQRVADPATWRWITGLGEQAAPPLPPVDTRLKEELQPGQGVAPRIQVALAAAPPAAETALERPAAPAPLPARGTSNVAAGPSEESATVQKARETAAAAGWLPDTSPEMFRDVEDDTKIRPPEKQLVMQLLARMEQTGADGLKKLSQGPITFVQLYNELPVYRGRVVTLKGLVGKVNHFRAAEGEKPANYYQLWIEPLDRPKEVICVYSEQAPENVPTDTFLKKDEKPLVECEAMLVKRLAYMASDKTWMTAPVMVAGPVRWLPRPAPHAAEEAAKAVQASNLATMISLLVVGVPIAVILVLWATRRTRPAKNPYSTFPTATGRTSHDFHNLRDLEVEPSVLEALKHLESPKPHSGGQEPS